MHMMAGQHLDPERHNEPQVMIQTASKDVPDKPTQSEEEVKRKEKHDQRGETFLASMCAVM
jgi:hypothetical protein